MPKEKAQQQQDSDENKKKREELVNFLRRITAGELAYGIPQMLATAIEMVDKDPEHVKFAFLRSVVPPSLQIIPNSARVTKVSIISMEKTKTSMNTPRLSVSLTSTSIDVMVGYVDTDTNKQGAVCLRFEDNPGSESDEDAVLISIIPCEEVRKKERKVESGVIDEEALNAEEVP